MITGAWGPGAQSRVNNIWITRTWVDGGGFPGIVVMGGWNNERNEAARNNLVSQVEVWCNEVPVPPNLLAPEFAATGGVSLVGGGGYEVAVGNQIRDVRAYDNLVAGVLRSASYSELASHCKVSGSCHAWTVCRGRFVDGETAGPGRRRLPGLGRFGRGRGPAPDGKHRQVHFLDHDGKSVAGLVKSSARLQGSGVLQFSLVDVQQGHRPCGPSSLRTETRIILPASTSSATRSPFPTRIGTNGS